jgi:hypothetical protein
MPLILNEVEGFGNLFQHNNATWWKIFLPQKLLKRLFNLNVCLILGPQLKETLLCHSQKK